jgi:hypothetical protein
MHARALSLIVVLALALSGCAGDGPAANTSTDWFSRLQREVLDVNCLGAGCHNPQSQAGGLVLSEGFSYDDLVTNSEPTNPAAQAAGLQRVVPFDPVNSFLLIKLTNPGVGQGDRMPMGAAPLSAEDLDVVNQWILAGAPPAMTQTIPAEASPTPTATETTTAPPTDTASLPSATPTLPTATTATATLPTATTPSPTLPSNATATASPSPTATQIVTLADVQSQVFTPNCLTAFCHTSSAQAGGMVLEDGASYAALVNVPAVNFDAANNGLVRVKPGDPDASFLYIKLTAPTLPQGSRMPMGLPPLSDNLIALVRTWIAQGANP